LIQSNIHIPGWFDRPGAYVLVDGQFGSTGKGLMAGWLAEYAHATGAVPNVVTTNAGPNSGHTAYWNPDSRDKPEFAEAFKVLTQQVPVASVFLSKMGHAPLTFLNAGAVIDPEILAAEVKSYGMDHKLFAIHPVAAIITGADKQADKTTMALISGTGKGIGPAMARKVLRQGATYAETTYYPTLPPGFPEGLSWDRPWDWDNDVVFVETAQGFSLGVNTARFFPYTTSRECTVMQAIADARIPARRVRKVIACFRTYPIRVGSVPDGTSGHWYPDQQELTWEQVGVEPELTTVTKRVRRVATWSRIQFRESVAANEPDVIFLNFCNYVTEHPSGAGTDALDRMLHEILADYQEVMGRRPDAVLGGFGPHSHDVSQLA
jgi:adenylosuccinate synthase